MKNFLLFLLAALIALALFSAGFAFLVLLGIGMAASGSVPYIPDGCIVTVDLTQPVHEGTHVPDPFTALQGGADHPLPAHEIAAALRAAASDGRIAGVL
ncbi:MAG: signal peptide peptidase SppA, partial [Planctomycetota bacterium]